MLLTSPSLQDGDIDRAGTTSSEGENVVIFGKDMQRFAVAIVGTCCLVMTGRAATDTSGATEKSARPVQQNSGYFAADDGVRLHYTRLGNGRDVVVVPNEIYMIDDFKSLAAERTVIFFDLRNRGRSDSVAEREKLQRGVHRDVDDLEALRKHFTLDRFSLVAHSYPSVIAALYAMKHPARVERIVQIGPPPADMKKPIPEQWRYADATSADVFAKLGAMQRDSAGADAVELCRRTWAILRPLYVGRPDNATQLAHWGFCELRNEREMMTHWNQNIVPSLQALALTSEDYAKARMPVLVIHGTRDRNAPYGGGREWARSLPNARLMTIEDVAHVPYIEERERVFAAMNAFLGGDWPAEAREVR
jgi:proline iminopeptidase